MEKENLGATAGLVAAAALMLDSMANVAVAISAGAGALASAVPSLLPRTLALCLGALVLLAGVNLRGPRSSGLAFAVPAYAFLACLFVVLGLGLARALAAHGHPAPVVPPPHPPPALLLAVFPGFRRRRRHPKEQAALRRAGRAAAGTLAHVGARLAAGVTTAEIDRWVREDTARRGGTPSQLGYRGFPAAVCTSRNHVVCHGIPRRDEALAPGDIVNVDVTTCLDGFHGDTSATFLIGDPGPEARHVVDVARRCRDAGIAVVRGGARLGDVGAAVEALARREGCSVVRDFGGHGIGRVMHAPPHVAHHGTRGTAIIGQERCRPHRG